MRRPKLKGDHFRPCLLLAHWDSAYASAASRAFRRLGWDVYQAQSGPEVRRLARMLVPHLVILGTDLPEESGWLTCDKLTSEHAALDVFLVTDSWSNDQNDFASFVGAAGLIVYSQGVQALLDEVQEVVLPAAS
jgi:DNA-binding response OmpR family regulator